MTQLENVATYLERHPGENAVSDIAAALSMEAVTVSQILGSAVRDKKVKGLRRVARGMYALKPAGSAAATNGKVAIKEGRIFVELATASSGAIVLEGDNGELYVGRLEAIA